jgi:hypothetical protein
MHPSHTFVPASAQTYGHLCKCIIQYIRNLSNIAPASSISVTRGAFLASILWVLSVALAQIQGYVYRSCVLFLAKAAGRQALPEADAPFLIECSVVFAVPAFCDCLGVFWLLPVHWAHFPPLLTLVLAPRTLVERLCKCKRISAISLHASCN